MRLKRIHNRRTSAAVAAALLSAAAPTRPVHAATVAHWRFEGDASGFLSDSSGNGHGLTPAGTGTAAQAARATSGAGSAFPGTVAGQPNTAAASFPGGTAPNVPYLTAADDAAWRGAGGTTFTLEALVNFGSISTSTTEYLAGHFGSTSERSWYVAIRRETGSPFVRFFADPTAGIAARHNRSSHPAWKTGCRPAATCSGTSAPPPSPPGTTTTSPSSPT